MKRTIILCTIFSCLLVGRAGFGQSGYWEELPGPPVVEDIRETADGMLWAGQYYSADNATTWLKASDDEFYVGNSGRTFRIDSMLGSPVSKYLLISDDQCKTWQTFPVAIDFPINGITEFSNHRLLIFTKDSISTNCLPFPAIISPPDLKVNGFKVLKTNSTQWEPLDCGSIVWQFDTSVQAFVFSYQYLGSNVLDRDIVVNQIGNSNYRIYVQDTVQTQIGELRGIYNGPGANLLVTTSGHILTSGVTSNAQGAIFKHRDSINTKQILFPGELGSNGPIKYTLLNDGRVLASYNNKIFISQDEGVTWQLVPNSKGLRLLLKYQRADGTLLFAKNDEIYRASNIGEPLQLLKNTLYEGTFLNFELIDTSRYVGVNYSGFHSTIDGGVDFWSLTSPDSLHLPKFSNIDSSRWLVLFKDSLYIADIVNKTAINITPNDSFSLQSVYYHAPTSSIFLGMLFIDHWVPEQNKTIVSGDFGATWFVCEPSLTAQTFFTSQSGKLFVTFSDGLPDWFLKSHLKATIDAGLSWVYLKENPPSSFKQLTNGRIHNGWSTSIDDGQTWQPFPDLLPRNTVENAIGHLYRIYLDTLMVSINSGNTWTKLPEKVEYWLANNSQFDGDSDMALDQANRLYVTFVNETSFNRGFVPGFYRSRNSTLQGAYLTGQTYKDSDSDCATPDPEAPLPNWIVSATKGNDTWSTNTDSLGHYSMFIDTGTYQLTTSVPLDIYWVNCADSIHVNLPIFLDTTTQDLPAVATVDCPYLSVDMVVSSFSPCFETLVCLSAHNYGTVQADSAWVDVQFPTQVYITDTLFTSYDSLGPGLYRIPLGLVDIGADAMICFLVSTICDTLLTGQTLCATAHVYPDSLCTIPIGWSGAQIEVTAECLGDTSVRFIAKNTTNFATQNLDFIIIEDDVVLMQGDNQYGPGQELTNDVPMTLGDHYYRFQSQQEPNHPFSQTVFAWAEGCGPGVVQSQSFVNQYQVDNGIPAEDVECVEVVAAYDPNDKRGFPLGFGSDQLIEPNTELEYIIRFQNTGTAAARFVVIRDTLSAHLDPTSIRAGASSHPYTWSLNGVGNLAFRFDPIHLPDSTTDLAGSQGFVSFRIKQKPNQPLGTKIENTAFIYFDYNGAVVTNTSQHTLGRDFLTITNIPDEPVTSLATTQPNPVNQIAVIELSQLAEGQEYQFRLFNAQGIHVQDRIFNGQRLVFDRGGQPDGMYYFEVRNNLGQTIARGKLVLQ